MHINSALIFGNNEYAQEIASNISYQFSNITIFSLNEIDENISEYDIEKFDLSDNWDELSKLHNMEKSIVFNVIDDPAKNIFLTISLRSIFAHVNIIAFAKNNEDANKLKIAGATKVIPVVETTANIITDMLKKPIITKVLHSILYEKSEVNIIQVMVNDKSAFEARYPADIDWGVEFDVLVLSVIHEDESQDFIYSSKTKHNYIKNGDTFIVSGYEKSLEKFKKIVGG